VNAEGEGVNGQVRVYTLTQQIVLSVNTGGNESGGPPVIGDFDDDGFPEFAIAGATRIRVFDFD
jgi:hypothetical protein